MKVRESSAYGFFFFNAVFVSYGFLEVCGSEVYFFVEGGGQLLGMDISFVIVIEDRVRNMVFDFYGVLVVVYGVSEVNIYIAVCILED